MDYIKIFLAKLEVEDNLSKNTISSYAKDLELFADFLAKKKISMAQVGINNIRDYLDDLKELQPSSIARKISCFKNFFKFLQNENIIKNNPAINLKSPKKAKKLPKFLSEEEVFKLLDFVNKDKSEFGVKLSCMLEILYAAGLRVSELVSLPISAIQQDFDISGNLTLRNYLIVKGKGNKERIAPLNKAAIRKLIEYLHLRRQSGQEKSNWLFVGTLRASKKIVKVHNDVRLAEYDHLTRQRFHQMLKELALKVNIDPAKVHPHVIRHSFATHLLNNGMDLRILQELLGHSDISTTEIYTHILDSKLQDLVFKHHPLAK